MHFKHRLGKRAARYAPFAAGGIAALERAGVRATYRLHDRLLSNPRSRTLFESHPPRLDEVQREIVESLQSEGLCVVPFIDLFPADRWHELARDAAGFTHRIEHRLTEGSTPKSIGSEEKPFARRYAEEALTLDSPWLRLGASSRMLDIVNTYLGMWSKLAHADQWYSPPLGSGADRVGSMRWHRDYNDQYLVKVFVHLCDVDQHTGPLEYVPGSAGDGRYADNWPWKPLSELYPTQEEFQRRIPNAAVRTLTGPEGSMIFCNTSGFHRGGHVTDKPRKLGVFHYVSPAALRSLVNRNFDLDRAPVVNLPEVERFALT
jgi:Phytanoyl-CoA dioxygenase (PhyH)